MEGLLKCSVNYVPLTPISFLERAANVFRGRVSIIDEPSVKYIWEVTHARCIKVASALSELGISRGDVLSFFYPIFCWKIIRNLEGCRKYFLKSSDCLTFGIMIIYTTRK
ncbi:hypothetical protein MTR67_009921 [Solanum verrucosum]|uniref:AMP-dependent synthetase/ligase domain-containing protein n=1 Tax=Solanum verrucosum TaxID=315347 RepID=A0AAF0TEV9_SOLVR|nr:hypothetical protein MTR67_009921 [Solanum verrucosum]